MKYIVTINSQNYEVEVEKGEARVLSITAAAQAPITAIEVPAVATVSTPAADLRQRSLRPVRFWPLRCPVRYCQSRNVSAIGSKPARLSLILEAMKMENEVVAMHDGTVAQILVSKGSSVSTGDPLVTFS